MVVAVEAGLRVEVRKGIRVEGTGVDLILGGIHELKKNEEIRKLKAKRRALCM